MFDLDPPNEAPITELYVYLSIDEKGNEGIVAARDGAAWFPLVVSKERVALLLRPMADAVAAESGKAVRLVKFQRLYSGSGP